MRLGERPRLHDVAMWEENQSLTFAQGQTEDFEQVVS